MPSALLSLSRGLWSAMRDESWFLFFRRLTFQSRWSGFDTSIVWLGKKMFMFVSVPIWLFWESLQVHNAVPPNLYSCSGRPVLPVLIIIIMIIIYQPFLYLQVIARDRENWGRMYTLSLSLPKCWPAASLWMTGPKHQYMFKRSFLSCAFWFGKTVVFLKNFSSVSFFFVLAHSARVQMLCIWGLVFMSVCSDLCSLAVWLSWLHICGDQKGH